MGGQEYDGLMATAGRQSLLQIQPAPAGHPDIEDDTAGALGQAFLEKRTRTPEANRFNPDRQEKLADRLPNRNIIIDDDDERRAAVPGDVEIISVRSGLDEGKRRAVSSSALFRAKRHRHAPGNTPRPISERDHACFKGIIFH